jgi:hypothetical protein
MHQHMLLSPCVQQKYRTDPYPSRFLISSNVSMISQIMPQMQEQKGAIDAATHYHERQRPKRARVENLLEEKSCGEENHRGAIRVDHVSSGLIIREDLGAQPNPGHEPPLKAEARNELTL